MDLRDDQKHYQHCFVQLQSEKHHCGLLVVDRHS